VTSVRLVQWKQTWYIFIQHPTYQIKAKRFSRFLERCSKLYSRQSWSAHFVNPGLCPYSPRNTNAWYARLIHHRHVVWENWSQHWRMVQLRALAVYMEVESGSNKYIPQKWSSRFVRHRSFSLSGDVERTRRQMAPHFRTSTDILRVYRYFRGFYFKNKLWIIDHFHFPTIEYQCQF
jgi:hypothetical protein